MDYNCMSEFLFDRYASAKKSPFMRQTFASVLGSAASALVLNPISVMKVAMQKDANNNNIFRVIGMIVRERGFSGFWAGSAVGLVQSIPNTVFYMDTYERISSKMSPHSSSLTPAVAGSVARFLTTSLFAPIELIRTQRNAGYSTSSSQLFFSIYRREGVMGFYKGWKSSVLRDVPYSAIYWMCYTYISDDLTRRSLGDSNRSTSSSFARHKSLSPNPLASFVAGSLSGLIAALITHPFDVLKTRQQLGIHGSSDPSSSFSLPLDTAIRNRRQDTLMSLYREQGLVSLYRGLSLRLASVIPGGAIMVTVYEMVKSTGDD